MIRYGCRDADLRRLRAAYALLIDFGRALTWENASFDKLPIGSRWECVTLSGVAQDSG
jgi:hypothetical protein